MGLRLLRRVGVCMTSSVHRAGVHATIDQKRLLKFYQRELFLQRFCYALSLTALGVYSLLLCSRDLTLFECLLWT